MITIFNAVSLLSVVHKIFSLSIELKYLVVVDEDSFNPFAVVETYVSRQANIVNKNSCNLCKQRMKSIKMNHIFNCHLYLPIPFP